jgi:hypothetical protein
MDINTLAAWGEFLGGLAVVVSLIYLAGQIRQNSRLLRTSTSATMGDTDTALAGLLAGDPQLSEIVLGAMADPTSLSEVDRFRFDIYFDAIMRGFQRNHVMSKGNGLDASLWKTEWTSMSAFVQTAGGREWWNGNRLIFGDDFMHFVDGLIREAEADG